MKYNELPGDNVAINQIQEISYKTVILLRKAGFDTVGQVRRASNETLMQTAGLTQTAVRKLRMWCPIDDATAKANSPEMPASAMTLRDHLAAQAMNGLMPIWIEATCYPQTGPISTAAKWILEQMHEEDTGDDTDWLARVSYEIADAMIRARAAKQEVQP